MIPVANLIGTHDVALITLDTLRYDVAREALEAGLTPNLANVLPADGWALRHSPGSFTYSAHHAFFAGFLPTPAIAGRHPRLFGARFAGSETIVEETAVFDEPDIVSGLAARGYHTICIGGVGFFNKQSALGCVLPNLFAESHWSPERGVTSSRSTQKQVELAESIMQSRPRNERVFLFLNVSAMHQPNCIFTPSARTDSKETMRAALVYTDHWLGRLFSFLGTRAPTLTIICSDHGTAYGEDGYTGHRLAHPVTWDVPYGEFILGER
jgi:hypothetical protein